VLKSSLASITCGNDDFSGRFVLVKCKQTSLALQIVEAMKKDHWKVVIGSHFFTLLSPWDSLAWKRFE